MLKAISMWQPWASLVALNEKRIETRGRRINHRGEIAIHAAKRWNVDQWSFLHIEPFRSVLADHGVTANNITQSTMPLGAIVGVADLVLVFLTGDTLNYRDGSRTLRGPGGLTYDMTPKEIAFGNYAPGRFGYVLKSIRKLDSPVPCRGMQALPFTVPPDVEALVREQLKAVA